METLNFPEDIDYQQSKFPELKKNNVDKSIITNTRKIGHVYKGFQFLNELEEYLFERISSFSNIKEISDEELIDIFHNIQIWGGRTGRQVYVTNKKKFPDNYKKRFEFNFSISTYRKLVFRCLNLKKNKHRNTDWIRNVTEWNYLSHSEMSGFKTSFSTKHLRFWLYSSLKEETLPIFDDVIERGFNEINTFNLNRENPEHLEFYWKQMIEKSKKEEISLMKLERLLFTIGGSFYVTLFYTILPLL